MAAAPSGAPHFPQPVIPAMSQTPPAAHGWGTPPGVPRPALPGPPPVIPPPMSGLAPPRQNSYSSQTSQESLTHGMYYDGPSRPASVHRSPTSTSTHSHGRGFGPRPQSQASPSRRSLYLAPSMSRAPTSSTHHTMAPSIPAPTVPNFGPTQPSAPPISFTSQTAVGQRAIPTPTVPSFGSSQPAVPAIRNATGPTFDEARTGATSLPQPTVPSLGRSQSNQGPTPDTSFPTVGSSTRAAQGHPRPQPTVPSFGAGPQPLSSTPSLPEPSVPSFAPPRQTNSSGSMPSFGQQRTEGSALPVRAVPSFGSAESTRGAMPEPNVPTFGQSGLAQPSIPAPTIPNIRSFQPPPINPSIPKPTVPNYSQPQPTGPGAIPQPTVPPIGRTRTSTGASLPTPTVPTFGPPQPQPAAGLVQRGPNTPTFGQTRPSVPTPSVPTLDSSQRSAQGGGMPEPAVPSFNTGQPSIPTPTVPNLGGPLQPNRGQYQTPRIQQPRAHIRTISSPVFVPLNDINEYDDEEGPRVGFAPSPAFPRPDRRANYAGTPYRRPATFSPRSSSESPASDWGDDDDEDDDEEDEESDNEPSGIMRPGGPYPPFHAQGRPPPPPMPVPVPTPTADPHVNSTGFPFPTSGNSQDSGPSPEHWYGAPSARPGGGRRISSIMGGFVSGLRRAVSSTRPSWEPARPQPPAINTSVSPPAATAPQPMTTGVPDSDLKSGLPTPIYDSGYGEGTFPLTGRSRVGSTYSRSNGSVRVGSGPTHAHSRTQSFASSAGRVPGSDQAHSNLGTVPEQAPVDSSSGSSPDSTGSHTLAGHTLVGHGDPGEEATRVAEAETLVGHAPPSALPPLPVEQGAPSSMETHATYASRPSQRIPTPPPQQPPVLLSPTLASSFAKYSPRGSQYFPPQPPLLDKVKAVAKLIREMPWVSEQIAVDYVPGSGRSKPAEKSWYAIPHAHQSLDLFSEGFGSPRITRRGTIATVRGMEPPAGVYPVDSEWIYVAPGAEPPPGYERAIPPPEVVQMAYGIPGVESTRQIQRIVQPATSPRQALNSPRQALNLSHQATTQPRLVVTSPPRNRVIRMPPPPEGYEYGHPEDPEDEYDLLYVPPGRSPPPGYEPATPPPPFRAQPSPPSSANRRNPPTSILRGSIRRAPRANQVPFPSMATVASTAG